MHFLQEKNKKKIVVQMKGFTRGFGSSPVAPFGVGDAEGLRWVFNEHGRNFTADPIHLPFEFSFMWKWTNISCFIAASGLVLFENLQDVAEIHVGNHLTRRCIMSPLDFCMFHGEMPAFIM